MEIGKFYYAYLKDIRGCSGSLEHDSTINFKYLYSYGSRVNDRPILLQCIKKGEIYETTEYYTGKKIGIFSNIEFPHFQITEEVNINNICEIEKYINSIPTLAINLENVKEIDENIAKTFYSNYSEKKECEIIEAIEHIGKKGQNSIDNTISKMERKLSFSELEKAYMDNMIYDMEHGVTYQAKTKKLKKDN